MSKNNSIKTKSTKKLNHRFWQNAFCVAAASVLTLTPAMMPLSAQALSQDETVYAKLLPSGALDYISVTEHLENSEKSNKITTQTFLRDIENLNGFESFALDGEKLTWEAGGKDIYYTGKTEQELPVQLEVVYKLDGAEKPIAEILGKSGHIEIELKYTNLSKVGDLYTPFVAAVSTTLPENSTRNVKVSNGKAISNGRTIAVAAVTAPGLYDSLKLDELKNLDKVVISFDTENFELKDIYSIITPKILDDNDLKIFDNLDSLYADADKLADGSKKLVEGTQKLQNGILELRDAVKKAQDQLANIGPFVDNKTLNNIASTASSSARKQVAAQQSTIRAQIHQQLMSLPEISALENAGAMIATLQNTMITQLTAAQTSVVCMQKVVAGELTDPAVCADMTNPVYQSIYAAVEPEVAKEVAAQLQQLQIPTLDISNIEEKLFQSTYSAIVSVAESVASQTARQVASQVSNSIEQGLSDKLTTLMDAMTEGVNKLYDGAKELNSGMIEFDRDGIQTLNNVVNNKLKNTSNKLQRLTKLADQYNNYAGIADGTTKFILMIDGQKAGK